MRPRPWQYVQSCPARIRDHDLKANAYTVIGRVLFLHRPPCTFSCSGKHITYCRIMLPNYLVNRFGIGVNDIVFFICFSNIPPNHLLLDSGPNFGPLISRWEINKFENWWYKSVMILAVLKLLFQRFLNLSSSQRDMNGPRLSNNRWSWGIYRTGRRYYTRLTSTYRASRCNILWIVLACKKKPKKHRTWGQGRRQRWKNEKKNVPSLNVDLHSWCPFVKRATYFSVHRV